MADYYPLVARAMAGLDAGSPASARRALYERVREALIAQMQSEADPPMTAREMKREREALEDAIRIVEFTYVSPTQEGGSATPDEEYPNFMEAIPGRQPAPLDDDPLSSLAQIISRTDPFESLQGGVWHEAPPSKGWNEPPPLLPPILSIPEQDKATAIAFRPSRRGPLDLLSDPPKDPLDPEQSQLYSRIRQQLKKLKEDIPSQERAAIDDVLDDFLDQPSTWQDVEFKKVLWLCGNALRNTLAQHDSVKDNGEPHYLKLPPAVAEALRRPVEAWNVFVLGDADLISLDDKRLGPREQRSILDHLNAARPIIESAASNREITTEQAGNVLNASLHAASIQANNINTKQAQSLADGTSRNLITQILRKAYLFCQILIDPQTEEARELSLSYKKGIVYAAGMATFGAAQHHAGSFFEFVFTHAEVMKEYMGIVFQNPQLTEIIDAIRSIRMKLNPGGNL